MSDQYDWLKKHRYDEMAPLKAHLDNMAEQAYRRELALHERIDRARDELEAGAKELDRHGTTLSVIRHIYRALQNLEGRLVSDAKRKDMKPIEIVPADDRGFGLWIPRSAASAQVTAAADAIIDAQNKAMREMHHQLMCRMFNTTPEELAARHAKRAAMTPEELAEGERRDREAREKAYNDGLDAALADLMARREDWSDPGDMAKRFAEWSEREGWSSDYHMWEAIERAFEAGLVYGSDVRAEEDDE